MMQNIKFTFLMAAYNAEKYITEAIESAINQTYGNFELLILDDKSTDNTVNVVESFNDNRIRLVKLPHYGSGGKVRAEGYKYITGDYVQILDADDYISPDLLENYVGALEKDSLDIIVPQPYSVTHGEIKRITKTNEYLGKTIDGKTAFDLSIFWNLHAWMCVRKELLISVGYDYEDYRIKTDELNNRKLFFYANKVHVSQGSYYYRTNESSVTRLRANFIKTVESLVDEKMLLEFATENAAECTQKKCRDLLIQNLFVYQRKYDSYRSELGKDDSQFVLRVLEGTYYVKELRKGKYGINNLFGIVFWLSGNDYEKYSRVVSRLNKAYGCIKRNKNKA
ncbi:glycosyltransferase family 2 protein [Butyrivibrio sp. INlla14]|uniref:glycosyltransferase family 2 protein n=1 Tax=Butyrivibrio sp. INlla14 TaxID=1520808 RepID=UPI0008766C0E|nr:glycosyltransferase family 2 protein [Butyrivibrio sp. INlla14]SCX84447.1 Glycosyl transferase family 2 [Butyrivibrio sp. INlla14]